MYKWQNFPLPELHDGDYFLFASREDDLAPNLCRWIESEQKFLSICDKKLLSIDESLGCFKQEDCLWLRFELPCVLFDIPECNGKV